MIEKKLGAKKQFIRLDTARSLNEIQSRFKYYKLALYLYSFSSFLDIMLLKNFDSEYLQSIRNRIKAFSDEYNEFYAYSMEGVEKIAIASVQTRSIQGLSKVGRFAGEQIAKIPNKNGKIKLGEKLIAGSNKLDDINAQALAKTIENFSSIQDNEIMLFEDRIALVEKMYNEPLKLYVGADTLYLDCK